jgi:hypothetical protein
MSIAAPAPAPAVTTAAVAATAAPLPLDVELSLRRSRRCNICKFNQTWAATTQAAREKTSD